MWHVNPPPPFLRVHILISHIHISMCTRRKGGGGVTCHIFISYMTIYIIYSCICSYDIFMSNVVLDTQIVFYRNPSPPFLCVWMFISYLFISDMNMCITYSYEYVNDTFMSIAVLHIQIVCYRKPSSSLPVCMNVYIIYIHFWHEHVYYIFMWRCKWYIHTWYE